MDFTALCKALLVPNVLYGYHNSCYSHSVKKYSQILKAIALVYIAKRKKAAAELDDKAISPVWNVCNELGTVVMIHLSGLGDVPAIKRIMYKYKNIKYVFCHMSAKALVESENKIIEVSEEVIDLTKKNNNIWL